MAAPCFLIRHPKGDLVWDLGLGDHFASPPEGSDVAPGVHVLVRSTLTAQLQALSLTPKDIRFIAFSHLHWDHTGNANLNLVISTWLMNKTRAGLGSRFGDAAWAVLPERWNGYGDL